MLIGIYGAGGFGRGVLRLVTTLYPEASVVFIDDDRADAPLPLRRLHQMKRGDHVVCAIGSGLARQMIDRRCVEAELSLLSVRHPSADICDDATIDEASIFCFNSLVGAGARIGRQFQCNIFSYVAHDCVIGDYVTFGPRVSCMGNVHVGDFAFIGANAVVRNGTPERPLLIGEGAVIGMGAVVSKDVPPHTTVVGNPARPIGSGSR